MAAPSPGYAVFITAVHPGTPDHPCSVGSQHIALALGRSV